MNMMQGPQRAGSQETSLTFKASVYYCGHRFKPCLNRQEMMSELTAQNCHAERQGELFSAGAKFRGLEAHKVNSHK